MIDKTQLIEKLGKKGFAEFVTNNRSNQPTGHDRSRGIKGRVRHSMCQHGVWVIKDYVTQICNKCGARPFSRKTKEFKPYFNLGLGAFVESRSEEKRLARSKGYQEAG